MIKFGIEVSNFIINFSYNIERGISMQTILNGKELAKYDEFIRLLGELEHDILAQTDYNGYPSIPNCAMSASNIYEDASEIEKKFMFDHLWTLFTIALTHWKSDMDSLWTEDGRKKMTQFMDQYKDLVPHMCPKVQSFYIGLNQNDLSPDPEKYKWYRYNTNITT